MNLREQDLWQQMDDHLIFYDADCNFCHQMVLYLIQLDREKQFLFAPLEGETAHQVLTGPNARYAHENSIVLAENFRSDRREFFIRSKAVFRIYWLLGRRWIGWLYFCPAWFCDWIYKGIAKHRHRLHLGWARPEFTTDRFLP